MINLDKFYTFQNISNIIKFIKLSHLSLSITGFQWFQIMIFHIHFPNLIRIKKCQDIAMIKSWIVKMQKHPAHITHITPTEFSIFSQISQWFTEIRYFHMIFCYFCYTFWAVVMRGTIICDYINDTAKCANAMPSYLSLLQSSPIFSS